MRFLTIFFTGWLHQIFLFQIYNLLLFSHPVMSNSAPMDCSTTGLPVLHYLLELVQTHTHRVSDVIQPSHPLSSPFPLAPNPSQHQVFSSESTPHVRWPKYGSFSCSIIPSKEIPGLISFRMDCWNSLQSKGLSRAFSNTTVQKRQFFGTQLSL